MTDEAQDRPAWWQENERLRTEMELPAYEPPRFLDGTYTHEVTDPIEDVHGCRVQFIGLNTHYPEDWEVRVDGEAIIGIGRHRDDHGNTVYEMEASEFRTAVLDAIEPS